MANPRCYRPVITNPSHLRGRRAVEASPFQPSPPASMAIRRKKPLASLRMQLMTFWIKTPYRNVLFLCFIQMAMRDLFYRLFEASYSFSFVRSVLRVMPNSRAVCSRRPLFRSSVARIVLRSTSASVLGSNIAGSGMSPE